MSDFAAISQRLRDPTLATRVEAMQELIEVIRGFGRELVGVLARESEDPLLVAEQIWWISPTVQPELESLVNSAAPTNVRVSAALLLLKLENRTGLPLLLEVLRGLDGGLVAPIANAIARSAPAEAAPALVDRIKLEGNPTNVMALIAALEKVGAPIPDAVRRRWTSPEAPTEVRRFIEIGEKQGRR